MNVWAISDLHLSFARPDHRERYAARWRDHAAQIERNWRAASALVTWCCFPGIYRRRGTIATCSLIWPGSTSCPGPRSCAGNHDQWWNGAQKIRPLLRDKMRAVDGDAIESHGVIVCGAAERGACTRPRLRRRSPGDGTRPRSATEMLEAAEQIRHNPRAPLYVLWHYPPFDAHGQPGPCVELLERYGVTTCVYGHLHGEKEWSAAVQGVAKASVITASQPTRSGSVPFESTGSRSARPSHVRPGSTMLVSFLARYDRFSTTHLYILPHSVRV